MSINRECSVWATSGSANTHHAHQLVGNPPEVHRSCLTAVHYGHQLGPLLNICEIKPQPSIMRIVSNCCSIPDENHTATHHQHQLGSLLGRRMPSRNTTKHYQHQLGMLRLTDRDWAHSHTSRASDEIDQKNVRNEATQVSVITQTTLHQHQLVPLPRPRSGTTATHDEHELGLLRCI